MRHVTRKWDGAPLTRGMQHRSLLDPHFSSDRYLLYAPLGVQNDLKALEKVMVAWSPGNVLRNRVTFCGISRENLRCVELTEIAESSLGSHVWEPRLSGADAVVVFMVRSRARNRAAIPAVELRWRDGERKLRADQEEGDAPHGPVPKRATPSKNIKKKKKRRSCPSIFPRWANTLCAAHIGRNDARPTRLSSGDRVRYVGRYLLYTRSERAPRVQSTVCRKVSSARPRRPRPRRCRRRRCR